MAFLFTYQGEKTISSGVDFGSLQPDTEYYVSAFGYNEATNSASTKLAKMKFKSAAAGNPTQNSSTFDIADVTANGANITVHPSDASVFYVWDVITEANYKSYGQNNDGLRKYLNDYIESQISTSFPTREDVVAVCGVRGESNFGYESLLPSTTYYIWAICVDASGNPTAELRAAILNLDRADEPVVVKRRYEEASLERLAVKAAADLGVLFLDGLADGIWIDAPGHDAAAIRDVELMILQAARVRFSHTEYIACPSCGRTLYDIERTLAAIKSRTSHLKNLKIGVMGCIVNGPGEMADADYGYVGAGPGRITLYKGREVVARNIPQEEALDHLVELIRAHGDWVDPEV